MLGWLTKKRVVYIRFYFLECNDKYFASMMNRIYKDIISRIGCVVFVSLLQYGKWAGFVLFIFSFLLTTIIDTNE